MIQNVAKCDLLIIASKVVQKGKEMEITLVRLIFVCSIHEKNKLFSIGQLLLKGFDVSVKEDKLRVFSSKERLIIESHL